ncbi:MAG: nitrogenase iron-molybdenum cofactor biosynthesis protein NifE [Candidatus Aureabacteria bacterium]|nr:nitrogenase iron-molybdenum cofactor biosynthesis protein NifE [Candidatus Auribacterota bacterium]
MNKIAILEERKKQIYYKGEESFDMRCERGSLAGSVSQRACVFCGSRVVLYPIADALHLVHGPIGCAAYTWDIRGALSSGPELHRLSFSTDLQEKNIIFGGEKKLYKALCELIDKHQPRAAFVYATCIVGIIGDDMDSVCRRVSEEKRIPVLSVHSEGFKGTKKDGYRAACDALARLVGTGPRTNNIGQCSINILGDFNIAGETWMIKEYYRRMGVEVISTITGDGRIADIQRAHNAKLNVVQCSGSMMPLAKTMKERYGIPFIRVSYFGIEDTAEALYEVARFFKNKKILRQTDELVKSEVRRIIPDLDQYKRKLKEKKAAIYVGGAFKAFSLIKALDYLEMKTVVVGSQTGNKDDYKRLKEMCPNGTIIVDDANPLELSRFILEKDADIFIGGVKERYLAYKLGIGYCDHNHQRKLALAGFDGMLNFAREVYSSVMSPVWQFCPRRKKV